VVTEYEYIQYLINGVSSLVEAYFTYKSLSSTKHTKILLTFYKISFYIAFYIKY